MAEIDKITNLSISAFWHRDESTVIPLRDTIGIKRVEDNEEESSFVHFIIHPTGLEFLAHMSEGFVEVRFNAIPLDNPFAGKHFITIADIRPIRVTIEEPMPYKLPAVEMYFAVKADCIVDWPVFQELNPEFQGDWRWKPD